VLRIGTRNLLAASIIATFAIILTGCQSTNNSGNTPADAWKYTAFQKAEQDTLEMAKSGKFGSPQNGTWNANAYLKSLHDLEKKYKSEGYR